MEMLMAVLPSLVASIPKLLADVTLLVVAVARWNRHPRVSMLASTSAVLMLVLDLLVRAVFVIMPLKLRESGRTTAETGALFGILGGVSGLLHAVAIALLVAAIFIDRGPPPAEATRLR